MQVKYQTVDYNYVPASRSVRNCHQETKTLQKGTCFDRMDAFVFSAIQWQGSANMAISILKMLCGTNIHFNVHTQFVHHVAIICNAVGFHMSCVLLEFIHFYLMFQKFVLLTK